MPFNTFLNTYVCLSLIQNKISSYKMFACAKTAEYCHNLCQNTRARALKIHAKMVSQKLRAKVKHSACSIKKAKKDKTRSYFIFQAQPE